jgi:hypothetical protein
MTPQQLEELKDRVRLLQIISPTENLLTTYQDKALATSDYRECLGYLHSLTVELRALEIDPELHMKLMRIQDLFEPTLLKKGIYQLEAGDQICYRGSIGNVSQPVTTSSTHYHLTLDGERHPIPLETAEESLRFIILNPRGLDNRETRVLTMEDFEAWYNGRISCERILPEEGELKEDYHYAPRHAGACLTWGRTSEGFYIVDNYPTGDPNADSLATLLEEWDVAPVDKPISSESLLAQLFQCYTHGHMDRTLDLDLERLKPIFRHRPCCLKCPSSGVNWKIGPQFLPRNNDPRNWENMLYLQRLGMWYFIGGQHHVTICYGEGNLYAALAGELRSLYP